MSKQIDVASHKEKYACAPMWSRKEVLDLFSLWREKAVEAQSCVYMDIMEGHAMMRGSMKRNDAEPSVSISSRRTLLDAPAKQENQEIHQ